MTRALAAVALLALPAVASAQIGTPLPSGPAAFGGMRGGFRPSGPPILSGPTALFPVQSAIPPRFGVGGGSLSGYPQVWAPSGFWGGVNYPWPIYPTFVQPMPVPVQGPVPVPAAVAQPRPVDPQIALSGQAKATLVAQFPAAAEIWVNGKKGDGDPAAEWTLTSPALNAGESYTFEVKGRWKAGGKTFEAERSVAVTAGDRSRAIIVTGTAVKE